jgi:hypothetical protein
VNKKKQKNFESSELVPLEAPGTSINKSFCRAFLQKATACFAFQGSQRD